MLEFRFTDTDYKFSVVFHARKAILSGDKVARVINLDDFFKMIESGVVGPPRKPKGQAKEKQDEKLTEAYKLYEYWLNITKKSARFTPKRKNAINARLREGYKPREIALAVTGMLTDEFCRDKNIDDIEWVCREPGRLERYRDIGIEYRENKL